MTKKLQKSPLIQSAIKNPIAIKSERCRRSLYYFVKYFWDTIIAEDFKDNWHIKFLCDEIQEVLERVIANETKLYDLIINIPPGTTKSTICTVMAPVWIWTRLNSAKLIAGSYSADLSLEHADLSREIIRSAKFKQTFPKLTIRRDKEQKSNYKLNTGGSRYSTSVGGTITGFHGHVIFIDDPINPKKAVSEKELATANEWMDRTLSTRKVNKSVTPIILIMQRLHEKDPSGHMLDKSKSGSKRVKHICLPGELVSDKDGEYNVNPPELVDKYIDGLLDPERIPRAVLNEMLPDLGQYGYSGQILQSPSPPAGGMFKTENFHIVDVPPSRIVDRVRYWDKAGTQDAGANTCGVRMNKLADGTFFVDSVIKGQWNTGVRERTIMQTAETDGKRVRIGIEQEPGSGGKESAENTIRMLAGYIAEADRPTGDKVFRADPYSVQVNWSNVYLKKADWNESYIEEHRHFPVGKAKDQVDASSGAFSKLSGKKRAGAWGR